MSEHLRVVPEMYAEVILEQMRRSKAVEEAILGPREERERLAAAAKERRAAERLAATPADLTVGNLINKLGISDGFAEHLVQPYCACDIDTIDSWFVCAHAHDLGVAP